MTAFGEVIARRELDTGSASKVVVELAKPISDGQDFGCAYRLEYEGKERVRTIYGVDSFQALTLALRTISVDLETLEWLPRDKMYWLGPKNGTGFSNPEAK